MDFKYNEIIFNAKPDPIPFNYRLSYRLALLCLILQITSNGRSGVSLIKIHLISTSIYTSSDMKRLLEYLNGKRGPENMIVRFDPSVNRLIKFAIYDGLIMQQKNQLYILTKKGKEFAFEIMKDSQLMGYEKAFLNDISTKLNENKIKNLTRDWGDLDDKI